MTRVTDDSNGYLYVIQFDNDVIKVGSTGDVSQRSEQHRRSAARYDLSIMNQWNSKPMKDFQMWERCLRDTFGQMGQRSAGGREYFRQLPYAMAIAQAERVHELRTERCCCGNCVEPVNMNLPAQVIRSGQGSSRSQGTLLLLDSDKIANGGIVRADLVTDERIAPGDSFDVDFNGTPGPNSTWTGYINSKIDRSHRFSLMN